MSNHIPDPFSVDEHVDILERRVEIGHDRHAERLAAERGAEILSSRAARERALEGDVGRGERAVGDRAAGPAGGAGDAEIDVGHLKLTG